MKLAIDGGTPVRSTDFPAWPMHDDTEREGLLRALDQGQWWRVTGKEVDAFEREFADAHGAGAALAVSTGTHALELALLAAKVGPGDEVIVPAYTFIATAMAVQRVGAVPVVVDVDPGTYCMDPDAAFEAVTPRTRAIIPVHAAGHTADMDSLLRIGALHALHVIQDAAHAHGARYDGMPLGVLGPACFSFQNFKLMTAGEGGAVIFGTQEERDRAFLYANCGRTVEDRTYAHAVVGSNYRMNEFSAAVLRAQLRRLPQQNETRQKNARMLRSALETIPGIALQEWEPTSDVHPHYMFMFRTAADAGIDRDRFLAALLAEGIPAFRNYRPVYRTDAFWCGPRTEQTLGQLIAHCPAAERIGAEGIWLHHRCLLGSERDTEDVAEAVHKVAEGLLAGSLIA
jgi:3-amino-5-hydroxybenzoate synthase